MDLSIAEGQVHYFQVPILEVLIEKGSAAVSCEANRTKTVCRTVEHKFFFIKVNNLDLLAL